MICVYGNSGVGSFATVSRGMAEAVGECGLLAGYFDLDGVSGIADDPLGPESSAPVALVCGDPGYLDRLARSNHRLKYLVLAPNSNGIYQNVVDFVAPRVDGLIAPSKWAASVLRRHFPDHDVIVSPHGIDRQFRMGDNRPLRDLVRMRYSDAFYVIHVTSTVTSRKGTQELVAAWASLGWNDARLLIYCHPVHLGLHQTMVNGIDSIGVLPTMSMSNYEMCLSLSAAHVVCQPSRAEGFGIVPLEARCSGVPVVMTSCTGHAEHFGAAGGAGVVQIWAGEDEPVEDYPGATAPSVTVEHVASALETMRANWPEKQKDAELVADELYEQWSWKRKNEAMLRRLVEQAR